MPCINITWAAGLYSSELCESVLFVSAISMFFSLVLKLGLSFTIHVNDREFTFKKILYIFHVLKILLIYF